MMKYSFIFELVIFLYDLQRS